MLAELAGETIVVRASTSVAYRVPTRDIIEKGIREQDLERYLKWEEEP